MAEAWGFPTIEGYSLSHSLGLFSPSECEKARALLPEPLTNSHF